jgi:hypothetical protein
MDWLLNPDKFFSERKNSGFKLPVLIVLFSAIIATLTAHLSSDTVTELAVKAMKEQGLSQSQIEMIEPIVYASTVGGAFVAVFVGWVVITLLLYLLSLIFKGKGKFTTLMKFVAFSYIPAILVSPITLYLGYESFMMRNPEALTASVLFGMVLYIWQAIYWVFAVKNARELSLRNSAIISAIVLILFLSASVYTLLQPSVLEMLR